jgi:hypothetical protein
METGAGAEIILRFSRGNLIGCNVGITDGEEFVNYAVQMG